jgi:hemoglobin-like flavoprotein
VNGLGQLERLVPSIQELGRRHVDYGVKDHHYSTVGAALLWTLSKGLGAGFTPEVKDAWTAVYGVLAKIMRVAAVTTLCERRLPPPAHLVAASAARVGHCNVAEQSSPGVGS